LGEMFFWIIGLHHPLWLFIYNGVKLWHMAYQLNFGKNKNKNLFG